jgi:hypothetical protein
MTRNVAHLICVDVRFSQIRVQASRTAQTVILLIINPAKEYIGSQTAYLSS